MQIKTLDGFVQNWSLTGHYAHAMIESKSSLHLAARDLLRHNFPTLQILEEVPVPIRKSEILYLDFFIPMLKLAIETHGEQHYKFVAHYHNNKLGFIKSQKRDREKQEWCDTNNIKYIALPYNETTDLWLERINHA